MECLDDNPIFRLNRWIGRTLRKRTAWSVQNIMRNEKFSMLEKSHFSIQEIRYFHLLIVLGYPIGRLLPKALRTQFFRLCSIIDSKLLSIEPLKKFAFKAVFELERRP